jgi:hypothetical protein
MIAAPRKTTARSMVARVIVTPKQASILRRSRSRNWIIAPPSLVYETLPAEVVQMPASAINR